MNAKPPEEEEQGIVLEVLSPAEAETLESELVAREDTAEALADYERVGAAAISDQVLTPQETMYEVLQQRKGRFGKELNNEQINEELRLWSKEYAEYHKETERPDMVVEFLTAILPWLTPLITATAQAGIIAEPSIAQPLRKEFRPQLPDIQTTILAEFRDPNTTEQAIEIFKRHGYSDENIELIRKASIQLPSAQDVISFGVREVYNPEIVRAFQLDKFLDTIEPQARPDVERTGMPWDEFKKYWRAHWILPGLAQSYEMLHRQEIDESTLRLIMRSQDIMPAFIEPLINISYNPLTRVDVRRMHKLGVITAWGDDNSVYRAYRDIGYSDKNAKLMTNFTIEYNKDPSDAEKDRKDRLKDLSKTDILRSYRKLIIGRTDARQFLWDLGYDNDELEVLIDLEDIARQEEIQDLQLTAWKRAFLTGQKDRTTVIGLIDGLDMTPQYRDAVLSKWDIEREAKIERPGRTDILKFLKKGIIDEPTARTELREMGYSEKYINWYIEDTMGETENAGTV